MKQIKNKPAKTVKCKLVLNDKQFNSVKNTLLNFNNACNDILNVSNQNKTTNKYKLQKLCYNDIRKKYSLSANLAVRAIARVSSAKKPKFFKTISFDLDARTFSFKDVKVSISSIDGRIKNIPIQTGYYQENLLKGQNPKSAKIIYNKKHKCFFIHIVISIIPKNIIPNGNITGIDRGLYNIVYCSDKFRYSGKKAMHKRKQYIKLRASLQAKGTKGAKKLLKRLSGKERRWMTDINHKISKKVMDSAKQGDTLILEDLKYIRERIKLARKQRAVFHSWSFGQLQNFLEYKALEKGILVDYVDPHYTSQKCSKCGFVHKSNRNSHKFVCKACGYTTHADYNGSCNIRMVYLNTHTDGVMSKTPEATLKRAVASPCL
ncbi:MAG: RNA-guided endonuclease InsQ/TnpB family protein [bacterium]